MSQVQPSHIDECDYASECEASEERPSEMDVDAELLYQSPFYQH